MRSLVPVLICFGILPYILPSANLEMELAADCLIVDVSGSTGTCEALNSGVVLVSVTGGGIGPYQYDWDLIDSVGNEDFGGPGGATDDPDGMSNLYPGTYCVTVTDLSAPGCSADTCIMINEPPVLSATFTVSQVTCNGGNDGIITLGSVSGTPSASLPAVLVITYDWDYLDVVGNEDFGPPGGATDDPDDITNLTAGDYAITVTAEVVLGPLTLSTCTFYDTLTVTEPDSMVLTAEVDSTECSESGAAIDLSVLGGTPAYIYDWSGGLGNVEDPDSVFAGTYLVTVTDQNGCTESLSVIVESYSPIEGSITYVPACYGDTTTLVLSITGGTEPYTFDWDNDGTGDNDDPQNLSVTNAGTYSVTIYDAELCSTTISITIINLPFHAQSVIESFCTGDSVMVNGVWYNDVGLYADTIPSSTGGCDTLLTIVILEDPLLTSNVTASFCQGDSVQLNGKWYSEPGNYIDTLSADIGCDTLLILAISEIPTVVVTIDTSFCAGDSVFINGNWYSTAGTYIDTLSAASGCDSMVVLTITEDSLVAVSVSASFCTGDSVQVNDDWYNSPGIFMDTFPGIVGCDTVLTIYISEEPFVAVAIDTSFCVGDSLFIYNNWYSSAGTYLDTVPANIGCDTVVLLTITETPLQISSVDLTICLGDSVEYNGIWYTAPGNYTTYLPGIMACDTLSTVNVLGEDCNPFDDNYVVIDSADVVIKSVTKGLILKSADGQCWKLSISVVGILEIVNIECPE